MSAAAVDDVRRGLRDRVAAGERAGDAERRRQRPAEHAGPAAGRSPGRTRRARGRPRRPPRNATATALFLAEVAVEPVDTRPPARRRRSRTPAIVAPDERGRADIARTSLIAAIGDDRAARNAGWSAAAIVTPMPITNDATTVRADHHEAGVGHREPERRAAREQQPREPDAEHEPDERRRTARRSNASASTEPTTCGPRAADRPQQPELAGPLRDEDRERVEDDEPADEQADAGEAEQRGVQERRGTRRPAPRSRPRPPWRAGPRRRRAAPSQRAARRAAHGRRRPPRTTLIASKPVVAELPLRGARVERGEAQRAEVACAPRSVKSPTTRKSASGPSSRTPTSSPTSYPRRRAVPSSIATSPSRTGRAAARRSAAARRRASVAHEIPTVGAPALDRRCRRPGRRTARSPGRTRRRRRRPGSRRTGRPRPRGAGGGRGPARRRRTRPRGARRDRCPRRSARTRCRTTAAACR